MPRSERQSQTLRLLHANVLYTNSDHTSVQKQIARENPGADEFKRLSMSIPVPAGLTRESPTLTFVVGPSTFTATGTCVDTTSTVSEGLHVVTRCSAARAPGDSRVFDADINLVLTNCPAE